MINPNIIILSVLPPLLYILVIFFTIPYNKVNLKHCYVSFLIGFLSFVLHNRFLYYFPFWCGIAEYLSGTDASEQPLKFYQVYYFIQVAFSEEMCKLIVFMFFIYSWRRIREAHPISIMLYCCMVSLGFSAIENIKYGYMYELIAEDLLFMRAVTAVVAHMVFGLFMGYWIALGSFTPLKPDKTLIDIISRKSTSLRLLIYTLIGLFCATILHGIYDVHLELTGVYGIGGVYILLLGSVLGAYWCFNNLNNLHKLT